MEELDRYIVSVYGMPRIYYASSPYMALGLYCEEDDCEGELSLGTFWGGTYDIENEDDRSGGPIGTIRKCSKQETAHKKIRISGTSYTIALTEELKKMGLGPGDEVKITLDLIN